MQQVIFMQNAEVDANQQLHITVPPEMGRRLKVIVLAADSSDLSELTDDEMLQIAAYTSTTESNPEEDAIWEQYVH